MIEVNEFSFCYEGSETPSVEDITLSVKRGSFVGITGHSGAGKTTLARALSGIIPHCVKGDFYGSVIIGGKDTVDTSLTELAKFIGSVCQDIDSAMVSSVVEDEILYGLENFGVANDEIEKRLSEVLEEVGISSLRHKDISSLSGGQKQKVAIAAILALKPEILILDEPTGELDPESSRNIFSLLKELTNEGITVVVVEQKIALLSEFADKIILMDKGKVKLYDDTEKILEQSEILEECGINCPRVVTLVNMLRKNGISGLKICTNTSSAADMLKKLIESEGVRDD